MRGAIAGVALACTSVAVLVASWQLGVRGMAMAMARPAPHAALRWDPGNAEALQRINEDASDPGRKHARALAILARRPAAGTAYRQLAEAAAQRGRADLVDDLYHVALRQSPRDRLAQGWWSDHALRDGNHATAMMGVFALVTMDPLLRRPLYDHLVALSMRDDTRPEVTARLAAAPDWRAEFFAHWAHYRSEHDGLPAMLQALADTGATLTADERTLWVEQLQRRGHASAAYLAWAGAIDVQRWQGPAPFNGDFAHPLAGAFDWQAAHQVQASAERVPGGGPAGGDALRVVFSGAGAGSVALSQTWLLDPGHHALGSVVRTEGLRGGAAAWRVVCTEPVVMLGSGEVWAGSRGWQDSIFTFHVPVDCPVQRLELHSLAGPLADPLHGTVWLARVRLGQGSVVNATPVDPQVQVAAGPAPQAPVALVARVSGHAQLQRGGHAQSVAPGLPLRQGDGLAAAPGAMLSLRWRNGCRTKVSASMDVAGMPDCAAAQQPATKPRNSSQPAPAVLPVVRANLGRHDNAAGNRDQDLPVGP